MDAKCNLITPIFKCIHRYIRCVRSHIFFASPCGSWLELKPQGQRQEVIRLNEAGRRAGWLAGQDFQPDWNGNKTDGVFRLRACPPPSGILLSALLFSGLTSVEPVVSNVSVWWLWRHMSNRTTSSTSPQRVTWMWDRALLFALFFLQLLPNVFSANTLDFGLFVSRLIWLIMLMQIPLLLQIARITFSGS